MIARRVGLLVATAGVVISLGSSAAALSYLLEWAQVATKAEVSAVYPPKALQAEVEGRVALSCVATASGVMKDCTVASEEPAGWGFGAAALTVSDRFKLKHVPTGLHAPKRFGVPVVFALPAREPTDGARN